MDTVATRLAVPWGIAVAPDGRLYVTERAGRIRVVDPARGSIAILTELSVYADDPDLLPESGLMGIALDPEFDRTGRLYVLATSRREGMRGRTGIAGRLARRVLGAMSSREVTPWVNRIHVVTGTRASVLVDDLPASFYHVGGALAVGPDGLLYASLGDTQQPDEAQRDGALAGRIVRYTRDGQVPASNPTTGSPEYARGLRNVQGFDWLTDGTMIAADHGPSGMPQEAGRGGQDELDVIAMGGNYGWPDETAQTAAPRHSPPVHSWMEGIAPAGLAVAADGSLIVTGLKGRTVRRVRLARSADDGGLRVVREDTLVRAGRSRFRGVAIGPDGAIYLGTSNRDGRGVPSEADDLILRLRPSATD